MWLSDFIKPNIKKFTLRFLISNAIGKILAGHSLNIFSLTKLINENNFEFSRIYFFFLNLLCASYILFIFLLYAAKRVNIKQKISQLSEEIKGL